MFNVQGRTPKTTRVLKIGQTATGRIHAPARREWFAVQFVAGCAYTLSLRCKPVKPASFRSPCNVTVHEPGGAVVARAPDGGGNRCLSTRVSVSATRTGTHYVAVGGGRRGRGTFELNVSEATRATRLSLGTVTQDDPGQRSRRYRLVGGNDAGLFALDPRTGELFFTGSESDLEFGTTEFKLKVRVSHAGDSSEHTLIVSVTNVPEAPPFDRVAEYPAHGSTRWPGARISLGALAGIDPAGAPLNVRLVAGHESGLFELDESTGELFFTGTAEDLEDSPSGVELTVRVGVQPH